MSCGFSSKSTLFPCSKLTDLLAADSEEGVTNMVVSCGLHVSEGFICFHKNSYINDTVVSIFSGLCCSPFSGIGRCQKVGGHTDT